MTTDPAIPAGELGSRLALALRSRPARWIGLLLGAATLALLSVSLSHAISEGHALFETQTVASLGISALGFLLFQAGAVASLHAIGGRPAGQLWAAAQLAKYLPSPGAALAGMVHSSVVRGSSTRAAIRLTLVHSGVLLAGGVLVGSLSAGSVTADRWGWPSGLAPILVLGLAGAVALVVRRGRRPRHAELAVAWAVAAWAVLGVSLWAGVAHRQGDALAVSTAFAAAWVVGFLALPVPAGLGVREAVLVLLLQPWLGSSGAASYAVLTRILHIASDGAVAAVFLAAPPVARAMRAARGRTG